MALAKPFATMPFPLGRVTTNAGTAKQIISNFTDLGTAADTADSVLIQALATNTNPVFILIQTTNAAVGSFANCYYILTASQAIVIAGHYGNQVPLATIWIDVTTNGEGVISSLQNN